MASMDWGKTSRVKYLRANNREASQDRMVQRCWEVYKDKNRSLLLDVKTCKSLVSLMCNLSGWWAQILLDWDEEKMGGDTTEAKTIDNIFKGFLCEGGYTVG